MRHRLVLGLFDDAALAAQAARDLRSLGVSREHVSIVAQTHDEEGRLAQASGASPGSEIEDSPAASRLGELSGHLLAAMAIVLPGVGPIVAAGPLSAGLGEAAGHLAGGVARALQHAGVPRDVATRWETRVHEGAILVGAHVGDELVGDAENLIKRAGAGAVALAHWDS